MSFHLNRDDNNALKTALGVFYCMEYIFLVMYNFGCLGEEGAVGSGDDGTGNVDAAGQTAAISGGEVPPIAEHAGTNGRFCRCQCAA